MNTIQNKEHYMSPQIEPVELDNEISLVFGSPGDPGAGGDTGGSGSLSDTSDFFNDDPIE